MRLVHCLAVTFVLFLIPVAESMQWKSAPKRGGVVDKTHYTYDPGNYRFSCKDQKVTQFFFKDPKSGTVYTRVSESVLQTGSPEDSPMNQFFSQTFPQKFSVSAIVKDPATFAEFFNNANRCCGLRDFSVRFRVGALIEYYRCLNYLVPFNLKGPISPPEHPATFNSEE